jgi:drug/metabolite transporter (DMT)-like permease
VATGAADRRSERGRPVATATPEIGQPDREPATWLPGVALLLVIVSWGLGPPITKLITAPPLVYVTVRLWVSVPLLAALTYATGGRITRPLLRRTWLAGALFGINLVFVFASLHHATVAVVSVISALQPGVIMLVGPLFGERPTRWHLAWTVVGIAGAAVVVLGAGPDVHSSVLGILLATAAMLTFTAYFLMVRRVRFTMSVTAGEWMTGATLFSAITVTIPALALERSASDWAQLNGPDWWYLAFIVVVVGIGGHVTMSWTTKYIQASRSSLYLLAMNVVAVGAAWPIHHEPLTLVQGLGGLIVLGAVAAVLSRPPVTA